MLSRCNADWRFYADVFRFDAEQGLLSPGAVQTLPNGFQAEYDGRRVRVVALHSDDTGGVYETLIQSWEVNRNGD